MAKQDETELPFGNPEIRELFQDLFTTLVAESDRGAVLVGAAHIDAHLRRLFDSVAPSKLSKKKRESLFDYPGPLSSFSARIEVAYATRLINRSLYDSLQALRRIRNEIAHHPTSFSLREQSDRIRQVYTLGPGVPVTVNRVAIDLMMRSKVDYAMEGIKHPDEDRPYFSTPEEVIEFFSGNRGILHILDEQLPRYELAAGIVLICALLLWHREKLSIVVGADNTLASLPKTKRSAEAKGKGKEGSQKPTEG